MRLSFKDVGSCEILHCCRVYFTEVLILTEQTKCISIVSLWSSILELNLTWNFDIGTFPHKYFNLHKAVKERFGCEGKVIRESLHPLWSSSGLINVLRQPEGIGKPWLSQYLRSVRISFHWDVPCFQREPKGRVSSFPELPRKERRYEWGRSQSSGVINSCVVLISCCWRILFRWTSGAGDNYIFLWSPWAGLQACGCDFMLEEWHRWGEHCLGSAAAKLSWGPLPTWYSMIIRLLNKTFLLLLLVLFSLLYSLSKNRNWKKSMNSNN